MVQHGYHKSKAGHCVYTKKFSEGNPSFCLYVDDLLIVGQDMHINDRLKKELK